MKVAHFHFDPELLPLLAPGKRRADLRYEFSGPQSAKHLIESLGIPHTEIGEVAANAQAVQLDYQVRDGDEVSVTASRDLADSEIEPRLVLDGHLGRLAAYLRMLGLDCLYSSEADDRLLASEAVAEERIILTRDRRLLMRKIISHGYLVRSLEPREQLIELVNRFHLHAWIKPFQRCIRCNHPLQPVSKEAVLDRLEPLTRQYFDDFRICPNCQQIYWKGSHYDRMSRLIAQLS